MSLGVLASGSLVRDPEPRRSKAGKDYVLGLMRVPPAEGEDALFVSLVCFSPTLGELLLGLGRGDVVSVSGHGRLRAWSGADGVQRHGLSVVVEGVLTPQQLEKRRRRTTRSGETAEPSEDRRAVAAELDRIARAQAAAGTAQVLTSPAGSTTAGLAEMVDDIPF